MILGLLPAIALNNGHWELFETPDLRQAKEDLRRLNSELEQRVIERTADLAEANVALARVNETLTAEVAQRKETEKELQESERQLRALSARVQSAREEEGTRIARELHDELGSALTSLKWERFDYDLAAPLHGIPRVDHEIHRYLLNSSGIRQHGTGFGAERYQGARQRHRSGSRGNTRNREGL